MMNSGQGAPITLVKLNHRGEVQWQYTGEVRERGVTWVCVVARFDLPDKPKSYVVFRHGDTFVEWHYSDRWYNVFEVHDVSDGHLKGWYCNVTRPAILTQDAIRADDLALDVFIAPDGSIVVDDEDEFEALDLSPEDRQGALAAVEAIRQAAAEGMSPFEALKPA